MMFMRLLCSACQKELGPTANQVSAEEKTCILNAALLLGRLAWLLKINGRFIADALQPIQGAVGNDSISDDQLFSAFEIADTNGDGLVTVTEATEALQALSLERVDEQTRRIAFLDPVPGATLAYAEFNLLLASILSSPSAPRLPWERMQASLDRVIVLAHTVWARGTVDAMTRTLKQALTKELAVTELTSPSLTAPTFKNTWRRRKIYLGEGEGSAGEEGYSEVMEYPTTPSMCLSGAFYQAVVRLHASCVSADTLHQIPDDTPLGTTTATGASTGASAMGSLSLQSKGVPKVLSLSTYVSGVLYRRRSGRALGL